jgi:hypothetical protein
MQEVLSELKKLISKLNTNEIKTSLTSESINIIEMNNDNGNSLSNSLQINLDNLGKNTTTMIMDIELKEDITLQKSEEKASFTDKQPMEKEALQKEANALKNGKSKETNSSNLKNKKLIQNLISKIKKLNIITNKERKRR